MPVMRFNTRIAGDTRVSHGLPERFLLRGQVSERAEDSAPSQVRWGISLPTSTISPMHSCPRISSAQLRTLGRGTDSYGLVYRATASEAAVYQGAATEHKRQVAQRATQTIESQYPTD